MYYKIKYLVLVSALLGTICNEWASERISSTNPSSKIDNRGVQRLTIPTMAVAKIGQNALNDQTDSSNDQTESSGISASKSTESVDSGPKWSYIPGTLSESEAGSASEDSSEPISPREKRQRNVKLSKQASTKDIKTKTHELRVPPSRIKRHTRQDSSRTPGFSSDAAPRKAKDSHSKGKIGDDTSVHQKRK